MRLDRCRPPWLLVSAITTLIFVLIATAVRSNTALVGLDHVLGNTLRAMMEADPATTRVMTAISFFGKQAIVGLAIVGALVLMAHRQWIAWGLWMVGIGGGIVLNQWLRQVYAAPRSVVGHPEITILNTGMPSGHVMLSSIGYGAVVFVLWPYVRTRQGRTLLVTGYSCGIVLIGISRLYLGFHYLSEVLAGYAAGAAWLSLCFAGATAVQRQPRTKLFRFNRKGRKVREAME
jgi:membrane-associated phospholipid phosphatase